MVRPGLTVLDGGLERALRPRRGAALAMFGAVAAAAVLATLLGADRGRRPLQPLDLGVRGERAAAVGGAASPEVRDVLRTLRAHLGERPLDAAARLAYAGVLREAAAGSDGIDVAIFHAERAAATAPVTAGLAGTAARILARSGRPETAARIVRGMFAWDPASAATLLRDVEPFLGDDPSARVVPRDARARRAWIATLRNAGRHAEARAVLDAALIDAPDDPALIEIAAWDAVSSGEFARLELLVPDGAALPQGRSGAILLALRALGKARRGETAGALADARAAAGAAPSDPGVLMYAGDALQLAGDLGGARDLWQRARFESLPGEGSRGSRLGLSVRLARLEERAGRPGDALRAWGEVLEVDPGHAEALRRREALRGGG